MEKAIKFSNWTKDQFSWKWDGLEYNFQPGESAYFSEHVAKHFAKHLANKVMNGLCDGQEKIAKGSGVTFIEKDPRFQALVQKALGDSVDAKDETSLSSKIMAKNVAAKKQQKEDEGINPEFDEAA